MANPFWLGNPAGVGQQTAAAQMLITRAPGSGMRAAPKRRRKAAKKSAPRARRASPAKRKSARARLVKGSAAAKAYMAKIRRKRK